MTHRQEQHLQRVKDAFEGQVDAKYRAGAAEHGDDLFDNPLLCVLLMAQEEALDQYVYITTAIEMERRRLGTELGSASPAISCSSRRM